MDFFLGVQLHFTIDQKQTFIDYARKAKGILKLNDQEANALIKHHKRKIAMAIKEGQKK